MYYAPKDTHRMHAILSTFREYLDVHEDFDILYSQKYGFVKITVDSYFDNPIVQIDSPEQMMTILFDAFADTCFQHSGSDSIFPTTKNILILRRKLSSILSAIPDDSSYYFSFLDDYIECYWLDIREMQ